MKIHLSTEEKNQYIERIQNFFLNERDEDLGIIAASTIPFNFHLTCAIIPLGLCIIV